METIKKDYKKPELETYVMKVQQHLLEGSMDEPAHPQGGDFENYQ